MKRANPTDPESSRMAEGVAKIPVPTIRLKMRKTAEIKPISRRLSLVTYCSAPPRRCQHINVMSIVQVITMINFFLKIRLLLFIAGVAVRTTICVTGDAWLERWHCADSEWLSKRQNHVLVPRSLDNQMSRSDVCCYLQLLTTSIYYDVLWILKNPAMFSWTWA